MVGYFYGMAVLSLIGSAVAALTNPANRAGLVIWIAAGLIGFVAFLWMVKLPAALRRNKAVHEKFPAAARGMAGCRVRLVGERMDGAMCRTSTVLRRGQRP